VFDIRGGHDFFALLIVYSTASTVVLWMPFKGEDLERKGMDWIYRKAKAPQTQLHIVHLHGAGVPSLISLFFASGVRRDAMVVQQTSLISNQCKSSKNTV